jgi:hypothetical protein
METGFDSAKDSCNSSSGGNSSHSSCNSSSSSCSSSRVVGKSVLCVTEILCREGPKVAARLKHLIADFAGIKHGKAMESLLATAEILRVEFATKPVPESL